VTDEGVLLRETEVGARGRTSSYVCLRERAQAAVNVATTGGRCVVDGVGSGHHGRVKCFLLRLPKITSQSLNLFILVEKLVLVSVVTVLHLAVGLLDVTDLPFELVYLSQQLVLGVDLLVFLFHESPLLFVLPIQVILHVTVLFVLSRQVFLQLPLLLTKRIDKV